MRYLTLRDCYVNDRLWREGDIYELPEAMEKSPKNFKPLDEPRVAEVKEEPIEAVTATTETAEDSPAEIDGGFKCEACGRVCKSEFGLKSHMRKHK